jgi:hypothetical protein
VSTISGCLQVLGAFLVACTFALFLVSIAMIAPYL